MDSVKVTRYADPKPTLGNLFTNLWEANICANAIGKCSLKSHDFEDSFGSLTSYRGQATPTATCINGKAPSGSDIEAAAHKLRTSGTVSEQDQATLNASSPYQAVTFRKNFTDSPIKKMCTPAR